jgi:hypothetical protein
MGLRVIEGVIENAHRTTAMLTDAQLRYFNTFGFIVLRNFFAPDEIKIMIDEFAVGIERANAHEPYDGSESHVFLLLGDDTPFGASIMEDARFLSIAKQSFGPDLWGFMHLAYRYISGGTEWHANDGSITHSRDYGFGPKFQWPLHAPVRADSGALRIISGSHRPPLHDQIKQMEQAGYLKDVAEVPCHVCDADPGDVVFFDSRIYHGTWTPADDPGDRRVASIMYFQNPRTCEDRAVMRLTAHGYYRNGYAQPWNREPWQQWLDNKPNNADRQEWIDTMRRLSALTDEDVGVRLVQGKTPVFEPVESA